MNTHKTYTVEEAINRMEQYCVYRERCHKEVNQKLKEMRMIPEAIDHIVNYLLQNDFLNESRFAKAFARGKFKIKKWGKHRIINELKSREITKYNIQIALKEIPDSEYRDTFDALTKKRWKELKTEKNLQKKRKKLIDYLLYRGWESELIYEKLNELSKY